MSIPPRPPVPPAPAARKWWQGAAADAVRVFHAYANWLVGITWKRFFLLSFLLLIGALILSKLLSSGDREEVTIGPSVQQVPKVSKKPAKNPPAVHIEKKNSRGEDVTISIDKDGVRITPTAPPALPVPPTPPTSPAASIGPAAASAPQYGSSAPAASALPPAFSASASRSGGVEIKLPPGASSEAIREAVEEARVAIIEAIHDSEKAAQDAAEAEASNAGTVKTIRRIRSTPDEPPFVGLAWLFVLASAILKITYKGTMQAEVKAAVATETAESEQLKRQVVEARMAAMQAQVEPHFLFNTLASIDHLIETDPPRASQMQKNLIALLRASMPSMRDATPAAHNLGREMAVIRPYLEILKVRMEDRLQIRINVPDGLLSAEFPSMMIQSLVENAIKHGLEPKAEGGELAVTAEIVHGNLAVTIADTGLGFGQAETAGTGIGLANIRERLKLLYGDRAGVTVADNSPSGTIVTLTVPYSAQARPGAST